MSLDEVSLGSLDGEPRPCAFVDLGAFEANVDRLAQPIRDAGKKMRIATKSLRCPDLIRRVAARAKIPLSLMTYTAEESAFWAGEGADDILLAYPTVQPSDLAALVEANRRCATVAMVDDGEQVSRLASVANGARVPVAVDVDMSWRPLGGAAHLGVRRSPLHDVDAVVALAQKIAAQPSLRFAGVMGYEAQIAGLPDTAPFSTWKNPILRAVKRGSKTAVLRRRAAVVAALSAAGLPCGLVNGGGTGSADWNRHEAVLTEVTVGSGFVDSTLFDHYDGLQLQPALFFVLQVTRHPAPGLATCHGGGYISSGPPGPDRLPTPVWPPGARLLPAEGAGEVQTPVAFTGERPPIGGSVVFRPAKAGELAEHFDEYVLIRDGRVEGRAKTYRGLGRRFLG